MVLGDRDGLPAGPPRLGQAAGGEAQRRVGIEALRQAGKPIGRQLYIAVELADQLVVPPAAEREPGVEGARLAGQREVVGAGRDLARRLGHCHEIELALEPAGDFERVVARSVIDDEPAIGPPRLGRERMGGALEVGPLVVDRADQEQPLCAWCHLPINVCGWRGLAQRRLAPSGKEEWRPRARCLERVAQRPPASACRPKVQIKRLPADVG